MNRRLLATTTVVVLLTTPNGCNDTAPPPAAPTTVHLASRPPLRTVGDWWQGGGRSVVTRLQVDMQLLPHNHRDADWVELAKAYAAAYTYPPVPDRGLQATWSAILTGVAADIRGRDPRRVDALDALAAELDRRSR